MTKPVTPKSAADIEKKPRKSARKSVAGKNIVGVVKTAEKKAAAPRKRAASAKDANAPAIGPQERHHLIEVAAYYVAERRGFHGASSHKDWLQAESEIDAMIVAGKFAL